MCGMIRDPASQIRAAAALCRNLIPMDCAAAYLLSCTLLLLNDFVRHTHTNLRCPLLSSQRGLKYLATCTSASPGTFIRFYRIPEWIGWEAP